MIRIGWNVMVIRGFIYAIVSAFFFGSAGIFIKQGYAQNLSPVELLILQYIIASGILYIICLTKYKTELKLSKQMLKRLLIQGIIGNTLMTVFLYNSMAYLDVAVTTMLLYTYPAMVALFSFFFNNQRISKAKITAIIGTFIGCFLVLNIWTGHSKSLPTAGIAFGILSAVFYSFMNIYAGRIVDHLPAVVITFYTTVFSLFTLLIFNYDFLLRLGYISLESFKSAAILAFFCEIIPLTLLYSAIRLIGPVKTSIISTIELPISAVVSFFMMHEKLLPVQSAGIVLVLASIILLKREPH